MKKQVVKKIKKSGDFSLQLDESTDIAKCIELLTYIPVSSPGDLEKNSYSANHWKQRRGLLTFSTLLIPSRCTMALSGPSVSPYVVIGHRLCSELRRAL